MQAAYDGQRAAEHEARLARLHRFNDARKSSAAHWNQRNVRRTSAKRARVLHSRQRSPAFNPKPILRHKRMRGLQRVPQAAQDRRVLSWSQKLWPPQPTFRSSRKRRRPAYPKRAAARPLRHHQCGAQVRPRHLPIGIQALIEEDRGRPPLLRARPAASLGEARSTNQAQGPGDQPSRPLGGGIEARRVSIASIPTGFVR